MAHLQLSDAEVADHIGTVMLSVVRDMAVSSQYGQDWSVTGVVPSPDEVFCPRFAKRIRQELGTLGPVQHFDFPMYGNVGDALGMLARLLVFCRDVDQLQPLVAAADELIAAMPIEVDHMTDSRFIQHLRNAVLHSHFKVLVDDQDTFRSRFVFLDINPRTGELTAKIVLTNNQLMAIVRVIVHQVFEAYLSDLPKGKKWVVAP